VSDAERAARYRARRDARRDAETAALAAQIAELSAHVAERDEEIADLRTRTAERDRTEPLPVPVDATLLRTLAPLMLGIPITPEGIASLAALGWLDPHAGRNPEAVAEAIVALAGAALDAGLRPERTSG
jgi:hypothetical protein